MRSRLTSLAVLGSLAVVALSGCSFVKDDGDTSTPEPTSIAQLTAVALPPNLVATSAPVALPPIAVVGGPKIELAVHLAPGKCAVSGHDRDGKAPLTTVNADSPAEGAAGVDASKDLPAAAVTAIGAANEADLKIKNIGTLKVYCGAKALAISAPKETGQLSVVGSGSAKMLADQRVLIVIGPPGTVSAALAG